MRVAFGLLSLAGAKAATAAPLGYGGRLTDAVGAPVTGPVDLAIDFFRSATGGNPLLATSLSFPGTQLAGGVFQVQLALAPGDYQTIFGDGAQPVFVEVIDKTHHRTYPRQQFLTVPYAARVPVDGTSVVYDGSGKLSVGAVDAAKVTGLMAMLADMGDAAKLQGVPLGTGTPAAGAVLKYVSGQWQAVPGDTVVGNFGIGTTSAQTALDVAGVLTQRGSPAPGVAPAGEGRIYYDASSNQFLVSQNGGAYAPLGTVTGGTITQISPGTGLTGGGTAGNVTMGLAPVGAAGTYTRVLTDGYGRVTAGGTLTAADLPVVPASLVSGSLPVSQISGTLAATQVAPLSAAQIQGGTLAASVIPLLSAAQITAGTLATAQLPSLSESQITSGTLSVALGGTGATSFPAGGVVVGAGSLPLSTVSTTTQSQVLQQGPSGPLFGAVDLAQSAAVTGTLAAAHLPPIPASLVSGTLAAAQIGTIPVGQLTGTLAGAQLGSHSAALITSGTLAVAQGGTGASTLAANAVLLGNGTSPVQALAPGGAGNVLTSNGTTWTSAAPPSASWAAPGSIGSATPNTAAFTSVTTTGSVGIGTTSPASTLQVDGSLGVKVTTVTGNTTLAGTDNVVLANNASNITITLPSPATAAERTYYVKKVSNNTNTVTLAPSGAETIDGASSLVLYVQYDTVRLVSDGANWYVIEDGLRPHVAAMSRAAAQSLATGASIKINLDTVTVDIGGLADPTTNHRINIRRSGNYLISTSVYLIPGTGHRIDANVFVNGANARYVLSTATDSTDGVATQSFVSPLNAGDYVELVTYHDAGSAINTSTNATLMPRLSVVELRK